MVGRGRRRRRCGFGPFFRSWDALDAVDASFGAEEVVGSGLGDFENGGGQAGGG